jgi:hypothetical protein
MTSGCLPPRNGIGVGESIVARKFKCDQVWVWKNRNGLEAHYKIIEVRKTQVKFLEIKAPKGQLMTPEPFLYDKDAIETDEWQEWALHKGDQLYEEAPEEPPKQEVIEI